MRASGRDMHAVGPEFRHVPDKAEVELDSDGTLRVSEGDAMHEWPVRLTPTQVEGVLAALNAVGAATLPPRE